MAQNKNAYVNLGNLGLAAREPTLRTKMLFADTIQEREDNQLYCSSSPESSLVQSLFGAWSTANQILKEYLDSVTLAKLLAG